MKRNSITSSYRKGRCYRINHFVTYHKASKYTGGGIIATWNPWHGCRKVSSGCLNCYVYRRDAEFGKDSSIIARTSSFDLPVKRNRNGIYKLQPDEGLCILA